MLSSAPGPTEIEVSIFGPGKGESIAVHLGDGKWIIVDSCVDQRTKTLPVLEYLDRIGVDLAVDVLAVVGTHAHDDHIAGISQVVEKCRSAKFVCSSAQTSEEFLRLVELEGEVEAQIRKGIRDEYNRVFQELDHRFELGERPLTYANENSVILRSGDSASTGYAVTTLSPSHYAFARAQQHLARSFAAVGDRRKLTSSDPNEFAIAIWVEACGQRALLGADLTKGPAGCGWMGVLDSFRATSKAGVFKVAHHGAPNAHHDGVWRELLEDSPIAVLAPYRGGRTPRPAPSDVARLCGLAGRVFTTADSKVPALSKNEKKEAVDIGVLGRSVRQPWGRCGHVRARYDTRSEAWQIDRADPAKELCI